MRTLHLPAPFAGALLPAITLFALALFGAGCDGGGASDASEGSSGLYGNSAPAPKPELPPIPDEPERLVEIITPMGRMVAKLYNGTPKHRDNFLKLASEGYYDGLLFHRVIEGFMIQGGDPDSRGAAPGVPLGQGGPGYTIDAEFRPEYIHKKGALAAARLGDQMNPQRASSGSQFYIVQGSIQGPNSLGPLEQQNGAYTPEQRDIYYTLGGTPFLDRTYTVFGEVIEGLEVIDKIAAVQKGGADRPTEDVPMQVRVLEE
jgi:cyclophilin family peptidyl-prolyl cis-trans isomerase